MKPHELVRPVRVRTPPRRDGSRRNPAQRLV